tara:strand:- start:627 stop:1718 length:1092 start_codon:yes stop_codon:yes gene_type:complete
MEENKDTIAGFEVFSNTEDLAASVETPTEQPVEQAQEQPQEPVQEQQYEAQDQDQEAVQEQYQEQPQQEADGEEEYSDEELQSAVFEYLSEMTGENITSLDDLYEEEETNVVDERVDAIARFVEETGRAPEDWFRFQSLNPEGMDDMTAIRIQMSNEYPNLSYDELNLLVGSKYKVDPDLYSEEEVSLAKLQLKMDGDKARQGIEDIRQGYAAPEYESEAPQSVIDEQWIANMSQEVDTLEGLEFDLGENNTFEFGLDDNYKSQLKDKQARLDEFFDPYVGEDGSWDYDLLSSHMAVIDNIDRIVKSAYTRGLGDGQRTLVDTASNVSTQAAPMGNQNQQTNPLADQVKQILNGGNGGLTFNI